MFIRLFAAFVISTLLGTGTVTAANYKIDTDMAHAFINFRVNHLGFSWVYGTFKSFSGTFSFDKDNIAASTVNVVIDTASVDTNFPARDKHLTSNELLDVNRYPKAIFSSTKVTAQKGNLLEIEGNLTLHGVTKPITIHAEFMGEGKDPWGAYRTGFSGTTSFKLKDFGIDYDLGPMVQEIEMMLSIEGVRQDTD